MKIELDFSYRKTFDNGLVELLDLYELFPFHLHPLWQSIFNGTLSKEQVLLAEAQHYLRTKVGQSLRKEAMEKCAATNEILWNAIIETYIEECTEDDGTPNHLEMIERLLSENGYTDYKNGVNTPANIAAISLYKNISDRGAGCHIIGAGMVEYFYSQISPYIYTAYTKIYGFSSYSAETYEIHGVMDKTHAERAFEVVNEAIKLHGREAVYLSVRDAFAATSLHYDGMLQAATGLNNYWNGKI